MLHLEEFSAALEREGLPPAYHWDAALLEGQQALPGQVGALEAFSRGLKALFVHAAACEGRDDFATMVMTEPEKLGPTASATLEEIRKVVKLFPPGCLCAGRTATKPSTTAICEAAGSGNPGGGAATGRGGVPQG